MDIFEAARKNDTEALSAFIAQGMINATDSRGSSPLIIAGYYNNVESVRLLLRQGADMEIKDNMGNTALMGVCFKGYTAIVEALCAHSAIVDNENGNGATALIFAATFGHNEIIRILLQYKARPHHRDRFGKNAVDYALVQENAEGYELLARAANEQSLA